VEGGLPTWSSGRSTALASSQGLTLVHFSAQLEPSLTHNNTLHTLHTPSDPLITGYTIPTRTPYPIQSAQVELRSERVQAPASSTNFAACSSPMMARTSFSFCGTGNGERAGDAGKPRQRRRRESGGIG